MILCALSYGRMVVFYFFSVVGAVSCLLLGGSYLNSFGSAPCHTGKIYDCRQVNPEAFMVAYQLVGNRSYAPTVHIYQYPDDTVTMISLDTVSERINFIFLEIPVRIQVINGKAPEPTSSLFQLAQQ